MRNKPNDTPEVFAALKLSARLNYKLKYFSRSNALKRPLNVLAVLANHGLHPMFARQAVNSG